MNNLRPLTIRLSLIERGILEEQSKLFGKPKAKIIRELISYSDETIEEIKKQNELLKEIKKEARMLGININQIAKKINADKIPDFESYIKELNTIWRLLKR